MSTENDGRCGGRGKCSKCGKDFNNVSYHESVCGKELEKNVIEIKPSKDQRIKELEEENTKLRRSILVLHDKLSSAHRRINRMYNDAYDDVTPEREDR